MHTILLAHYSLSDVVNKERRTFLAVCYDMAESVVGDIPTYAGVPKGRHAISIDRLKKD